LNGNAVSDLVLALACAWICLRTLERAPGIAVAVLLIGLSAVLGVLRFSGAGILDGPHRFASLVSAVGAFPLLAYALGWPDDTIATRASASVRFVVLVGAIGVAATVLGVEIWSKVAPATAALVILVNMLRRFSALGLMGALLLAASFAVAAVGTPDTVYFGLLNRVQLLHYLLAAALLALTWTPLRQGRSAAVSR
jgi:hypothetical protein